MKIQRIGLSRILACLLATQTIVLVANASAADGAQEQVKALMQRYNQVEEQLPRLVHYRKKEGSEPETTVQQAWFHEDGALLKVATERTGAAGRELKEFFPYEPDEDPENMMMFALTRRETSLPQGATRVEEERLYLARSESAGLVTLRKLTKSAEFKAGQPLEMGPIRNVVHKPMKRPIKVNEEASDWEWMEEPKKIAQTLRTAGPPERGPAAEDKGAAPVQTPEQQAPGSISPDGKWEFRLTAAGEESSGYGDFVIAKRGSQETSVALSEEASGPFAEHAKVIWAPDSKRFAFNYAPGLRGRAVQFFQLHGDEWRELDSPDSDDAITAPLERSMAVQRKKLKLSPKLIGRPISDGCELRRWIDPSTALLHAFSHETFEIKGELEQVGDACFVTLKFDAVGEWKIARTRFLLESKAVRDLNKMEQEELARLEKESD